MSNSKFASAAIAYFAESGLDPTAERVLNLSAVAMKVNTESQAVQQRVDDVGNRLMSMLRAWEQQQYQYQQTVQNNLYNYLEQVERNLLVHQQNTLGIVSTRILSPLLEHGLRGTIDSYMTRALTERVLLKVRNKDESEWEGQSQNHDQAREKKLEDIMKKLANLPAPAAAVLTQVPLAVATPARGPGPIKKGA